MVSGSFCATLTSLDTVVMSVDWLFLSVALFSALVLALVTVSIIFYSFSLLSTSSLYVWYWML